MITESEALRKFVGRVSDAMEGKSSVDDRHLRSFVWACNPKYDGHILGRSNNIVADYSNLVYEQDGHIFRVIEIYGGEDSNQDTRRVFVMFDGTESIFVISTYFSSWDDNNFQDPYIEKVSRELTYIPLEVFRTASGDLYYETSEEFIRPVIQAHFKEED